MDVNPHLNKVYIHKVSELGLEFLWKEKTTQHWYILVQFFFGISICLGGVIKLNSRMSKLGVPSLLGTNIRTQLKNQPIF